MVGGISKWKEKKFPTKKGNHPPDVPEKPSGSTIINIETAYNYSTRSIDFNDDSIRYGWDWNGDNRVDEWTDYYPNGFQVNTSHAWNDFGVFKVQVKAEDNVGNQSGFSPYLTIVTNNPPTTPDVKGVTVGRTGKEYTFTCTAVDPDNHELFYYFDWGDGNSTGWIGPFNSYENAEACHIWMMKGDYEIRVKARDSHDGESTWGFFQITMSKTEFIVFQRFFLALRVNKPLFL
jgi:hypothetical protein